MNWIQSHIVEIFAVIGSLYAAARVIVAMTPTPKDDAALAKVWIGLRALARAFGLDLKQGVEDKTPKKPDLTTMGILLLSLLLVTGCSMSQQISPEADLLIAQKTFTAIVKGLTEIQIAGGFEEGETVKLTVLIHECQEHLILWETMLREGQATPAGIVQTFDELVHKLIEFQLKGGV